MDQPNATQRPDPDQASTQRDRPEEEAVRRALEDYYRAGKPPWDTGVTPPELVALVEGHGALPPGRALELGCGTGTNAIYLARHGWEVVAVDLIDRAVDQARAKAAAAGVAVRLLCGDATRLDELDVPGPYDLFFDLSCYCGIPLHRRDAYAAGLTHRAAPGARLLMFGYGPEALGNPIPESSGRRRHRRRAARQVHRLGTGRHHPGHQPGADLLVHAAPRRLAISGRGSLWVCGCSRGPCPWSAMFSQVGALWAGAGHACVVPSPVIHFQVRNRKQGLRDRQ